MQKKQQSNKSLELSKKVNEVQNMASIQGGMRIYDWPMSDNVEQRRITHYASWDFLKMYKIPN
ncbi:MAG TPA: hypothetical protein VM802_06445 [Chitinophaga sp.]|uniref:hypothetical protein n=1 Tax=Chitinophaga sp. TaxID=1869181 RepID=UPI002C95C0A8|nr:hypothetical protein [Chitinophaga sp.]HVI44487.1 hypothetical protein [Chitinophaga sp.]